MTWYIEVLKKYAVFHGRARRKEYWMFFLFNIIIAAGLGAIERIIGIAPQAKESVLVTFYQLAIVVPQLRLAFGECTTQTTAGGGCCFRSSTWCSPFPRVSWAPIVLASIQSWDHP